MEYSSSPEPDSEHVAGAADGAEFWLPLIHRLGLDLLDVAFSGGLAITEEYYSRMIEQVGIVLSEFKGMPGSTEGIDDAILRCTNLLEILKKNPPGSGCRLYLG
jgi:hypothetical protein